MVHRMTPVDTSFRGYSGGGCRLCIDTVDDSKLMQESNGAAGLKGETWPTSEAPQNYGFTSVVADATKGANGAIKQCAEAFMSFLGGNRNLPITGHMDDRRHRLKNLAQDAAKGAVAMFGLKEWGQQFLNTEKGMFMTGNTEKKMRFALVDNQNGKTQQQGGSAGGSGGGGGGGARELPRTFQTGSGVEFEIETFVPVVSALANGSGGGGGGAGGNGGETTSKPTGQKTLHKEQSTTFTDMTAEAIHNRRGTGQHQIQDTHATNYMNDVSHSCQSTKDHSHIKAGASIWVANGCFSDMPIIIKKDALCVAPKAETQDSGSGSGTS
jgi:hypothetical protein